MSEPDVLSLVNDWFTRVVNDGALVACGVKGGFIDIGVSEGYESAKSMFADVGDAHCLTLFDRDGTINFDTSHVHRIEDCELVGPMVEAMRRFFEDPAWRLAVVTNQVGIAKGVHSVVDIRLLHCQMMRMPAKRGVTVDAWYFCPHHPDFAGECACRKPAPGMLQRVMRDYRVDLGECVMFGDSEKDKPAAGAGESSSTA